ncbi:uncharacterized protein LOC123310794 [Coccinella septempunctata]|uniref:uncharacterized protein LOC123310794 n=1 Tax=Coccinella septempunctata TaxID=41139 RepID=UPI001D0789C1|nr:uncharacterized protein LOC123310794 [Coccinella septempunctata]
MVEKCIISTFEKEMNGRVRKFWVQVLPDDQKDKTIDYFCKYFIRDEPLSKSLKLVEDEESMKFIVHFWRNILEQNKTLACFTELDNGQKELVAANLCYQTSITEELMKKKEGIPEAMKQVLDTLHYLNNKSKDLLEGLGIREYLGAVGLVTIPGYRGFNIGLEVLKARKFLCGELGLNASITTFTGPASQRLAEKVGFKDLVSITYDDLEKLEPSFKYPNINEYSKCIRHMYNLYE